MIEPKVSILMPVYNAENYIASAIESILNQTYHNFEFILINDCPEDYTLDVVSKFKDNRIRIINNDSNKGIAYSRNRGLDNCTGKYIALMDDDDVALPKRLELQVNYLEEHQEIDVLGGGMRGIDENDNVIYTISMVLRNPHYIKAMLLFRNVLTNGTAMIRRDFISQFGLRYEDKCLGMEDFKFWIECSKVGKITNIDEVLLLYRDTSNNETSRVKKELYQKRKKLYADFQRYSLEKSGFNLSEDEFLIINKIMAESNGRLDSEKEIFDFYLALRHIVLIAREQNCDNCKEVEIACRKIFGEKIGLIDWIWK